MSIVVAQLVRASGSQAGGHGLEITLRRAMKMDTQSDARKVAAENTEQAQAVLSGIATIQDNATYAWDQMEQAATYMQFAQDKAPLMILWTASVGRHEANGRELGHYYARESCASQSNLFLQREGLELLQESTAQKNSPEF
ncbi:hypothetical protein AXG93_4620s2120 [Marchantia polymorpha subsp. ruderalis]|uniref:Uncharacterized protein n=1 Tax=Marchantia polymorpha subsp. ruderalis TaxID=1480154 RepID=A0A176VXA8_MARPO|nr:hypothetical protein AXG93_4620s2120 [Marchantia polymorpha subsp. ruderalis]